MIFLHLNIRADDDNYANLTIQKNSPPLKKEPKEKARNTFRGVIFGRESRRSKMDRKATAPSRQVLCLPFSVPSRASVRSCVIPSCCFCSFPERSILRFARSTRRARQAHTQSLLSGGRAPEKVGGVWRGGLRTRQKGHHVITSLFSYPPPLS